MSSAEIVGLALTVALLGAVVGAIVTAVAGVYRQRCGSSRRLLEGYAAWLAARKTHTRTSLSFVAAFRALAMEDRASDYFLLRRDEAQRARSIWCNALSELDRAESALLTMVAEGSVLAAIRRFPRVTPHQLREAIDGELAASDSLRAAVRRLDDRATDFVIARTHAPETRELPLTLLAGRALAFMATIVDRLGGRR